MSKLTQEKVRELFDYDTESGILSWKVQKANVMIGDEAGCIGPIGYKIVGINYKTYYVHRVVWLYVH